MEAEYHGAGTLLADGQEVPVEVHLSGHVEPTEGTYRWAGRIERSTAVSELAAGRPRTVTLRTGDAFAADGSLGEQDPWGGFRISGKGAPPFYVPTEPADAESA